MTPEDAAELVQLCNKALEDLQKYDDGTSYDELEIGTTLATIVSPMIQGGELIPELKKVVPATSVLKLKQSIRAMSGPTSYARGQAVVRYGEAVSVVRESLQKLAVQHADAHENELVTATTSQGTGASTYPRVEDLLHPVIVRHALSKYRNGDLRNAVLDGVIAVFDMIRARTGLQQDGKDLIGQAFGLANGRLIFSEIETATGQNDQKGFLMIFEGVYTGVRNVKAHSLEHDLTEVKALQYLVTLSLLARRVDECKPRV